MRQHPHPITAQIDSLAASAASVIAANCSRCVMVPGSMQMIHRCWSIVMGNCEDLRTSADLAEKIDGLIADAYFARSGDATSRDAFVEMMAAETWFTPEEAIAAGLADAIAEDSTQRAQQPWDLSAFAHAPQVDASDEDDVNETDDALPDDGGAPDPVDNENDASEPIAARAERARDLRLRLLAKPI